MNRSKDFQVDQLKHAKSELFDQDVLHILNGQAMYEDFEENKVLGDSDYVPFNEAMCVNAATIQVFDPAFIKTRASGHRDSVEDYINKVIEPLNDLFNKQYSSIVLWFGEDMFCQMNLLTLLAYLEQSGYQGTVFLNSFREDECKVCQTELTLADYHSVYKEVLVHHEPPTKKLLPIMHQAIDLYLDMLKESNAVVTYISKNKHLTTSQLVSRLFELFPTIGYGDSQYIELINKTR
ncbi:AraC family transcriptional regulator [Peribacillus muralis]|uniref:AraC family transcriptional regulator n=1 Tax=Peribacillus muralis TaxID=264697 RepID=A0A1B3XTS6_9BACI|nr:AraC family transcriptional regulator [Peribacillus muralis]